VDGSGGGVLDLVQRVQGGSRQGALRWTADFAGIPLADHPLSPEERKRWKEERRALEADSPDAHRWRRTFCNYLESEMDSEKAKLFGGGTPDTDAIRSMTDMLTSYRQMTGAVLVHTYRTWRERQPTLTAWFVRRGYQLEETDRVVLFEYLKSLYPEWKEGL
jgi:hypothetical protein